MERDFPDNYNDQVADVLEAMSLSKGENMVVIGSGALRPIIYAGDYDANEILKQSPAQVAKGLKDVVRRLKKMPKVIIGDIKLGGTMDEPRRWKPEELLKSNLTQAIGEPGLRKIDAVANVNGRYIEFSTVYLYPKEELNTKDYIKDLQRAAREKIGDGNYWKALKRWFSIQRLRGVKKDVEELIPIFNGDLGILYSVMSDIEVLMYLIQNKKGSKELIRAEIQNFKDRLSHIWNTPEFQKKEPKFLEELERAEGGDLRLLERLYNNFWSILQKRAKVLVKKYVKRLHGSGLGQSKAKVAPAPLREPWSLEDAVETIDDDYVPPEDDFEVVDRQIIDDDTMVTLRRIPTLWRAPVQEVEPPPQAVIQAPPQPAPPPPAIPPPPGDMARVVSASKQGYASMINQEYGGFSYSETRWLIDKGDELVKDFEDKTSRYRAGVKAYDNWAKATGNAPYVPPKKVADTVRANRGIIKGLKGQLKAL